MERITDLEELKNRLVEMMSKGIEVDQGVYRKMDPIDYYELTNIEPKYLYRVLNKAIELTPHERSVIVSYATKCNSHIKMPKEAFLERILKEKLNIKGIDVTDDMKLEAVQYMEENDIPLAYLNYVAYIRRVVNTLVVDMKRD